ncbi:ATP/GTP-binding protein [Corynebacterium riegelii]|uniref:ATP/GTP-binding protein n=1 Tax=Corynebacterium riegelii TaxID=156976 RepID=UPI0028890CFA|nr:ATP/GTP-binding protein [Corynebacterium riegelii]
MRVDEFLTLHEAIEAGERKMPAAWTWNGWWYRQFLKANPDLASAVTTAQQDRLRGQTRRGRLGRFGMTGKFGGASRVIAGPVEFQTTTNLGCGFNPNSVGAAAPAIGTPIGRHATTGADVGFDGFAWFMEQIIANPSAFVLGLPGLGKSTLIRKLLIGHVAQGHISIVAGDIKAEYVGFTQAVGGQVIQLGHGAGALNPLDVGALGRVIPTLEAHRDRLEEIGRADLIRRTKEQIHGRQVALVSALVGLARANNEAAGHGIADYEAMIIAVALRELYDGQTIDWEHPPILADLIAQIEAGSAELRDKARAETEAEWKARVDPLLLSLHSLLDGATGQIFGGQTTQPIDVTAPAVCIDVSAIDRGDRAVKAAVMIACWSNAFGSIEASHVLADAGIDKQRYFAVCLDELWQTLAAAPGLVGQVDALTRLNRSTGTALYMITHTFKDLQAVPTEQDRRTAMGFVERAGVVICGGLPHSELELLSNQLPFTEAEAEMITSWSRGATPKRSRSHAAGGVAPGRGRFMIKASKDGTPGIPIQTVLFSTEQRTRIHDTNTRFDDFGDN